MLALWSLVMAAVLTGCLAFRGPPINTRLPLRLYATSLASGGDTAIIGGGLAGLGLAFNLLEKSEGGISITIYDKAPVGEGGASSVAGGLVHPLSPRGKLVHWGLEGLACTNRLVEAASRHAPECILRDKIYRVALSDKNVLDLQHAASILPDHCEWLDKHEMDKTVGSNSMGGLVLSNGCRVIHVPSYLRGLYAACQEMGSIDWQITNQPPPVNDHNVVVWAGGAGMIQDKIMNTPLPVALVRGASVELKVETKEEEEGGTQPQSEAVLCGKYISPVLQDDKMLVGATHEFREEALTDEEVYDDLKSRSYSLSPALWDSSTLDRVTVGYRVQSQRNALGRIPIIGKLTDTNWIFSGLSSRGLLYHGIYGEKLADMILHGDVEEEDSHLNWWR